MSDTPLSAEVEASLAMSPIVDAAWRVIDEAQPQGEGSDYSEVEKRHLATLEAALDAAKTFGTAYIDDRIADLKEQVAALTARAEEAEANHKQLHTAMLACMENHARCHIEAAEKVMQSE